MDIDAILDGPYRSLDILPARVPVSGGILLRHLCVLAVFRRTS